MQKMFSILIHQAEEGGYWAECPALKGCFTQGETLTEVKNNMREAIELYLDDYVYPADLMEETLTVEVRQHA
jgi:predicted RNase H-like HicB family nuclease